ncbi:hypothetical protein FB451DRAFT_1393777 [Mycena latifolia]|nr:hypothetical protein FB451DRAFT_1393777 [Mycena latifolia]
MRPVTAAPIWNGKLRGNSHYRVRPVTSAPNSTVRYARSSALHVPVSPPVQHCVLTSSRPLTHSDASQTYQEVSVPTDSRVTVCARNRGTLRASLSFYYITVVALAVSIRACARTLRLSRKVLSAPSLPSFMCDQHPGSIWTSGRPRPSATRSKFTLGTPGTRISCEPEAWTVADAKPKASCFLEELP